jgi:hypothetical protein
MCGWRTKRQRQTEGVTVAVVPRSMGSSWSGSRTPPSWDRCSRGTSSGPYCLLGEGKCNYCSMTTGVQAPRSVDSNSAMWRLRKTCGAKRWLIGGKKKYVIKEGAEYWYSIISTRHTHTHPYSLSYAYFHFQGPSHFTLLTEAARSSEKLHLTSLHSVTTQKTAIWKVWNMYQ